jgi:hypothetical protein
MMKPLIVGFAGLLIATLAPRPASAWSHSGYHGSASGGGGSWSASGRYGGSASGSGGSWSGTGRYGGTASGGDGSWSAHSAAGGSASGGDGTWSSHSAYGTSTYHTSGYYGGATTHTNSYGATTATYHTTNYYGGSYAYYHPPTTVNVYGSTCTNCGGWSTGGAAAAGMAVGMVAGAAVASSQANASSANAYNAGYVAGSSNTAAVPTGNYPVGAIYATLPAGCMQPSGLGSTYYLCSNNWFKPSYGANGVYYRVVTAP